MKREMVVMQKDVDVLDRISKADDLYGIREASQILQMQEKKFTEWLQRNAWCFRHSGNRTLMAYGDKRRSGYALHKLATYTKPDGTEGTRETLKFTTAGIVALAKRLNVVLADDDLRVMEAA
jgi:phage antirepressor YoqD-like protein